MARESAPAPAPQRETSPESPRGAGERLGYEVVGGETVVGGWDRSAPASHAGCPTDPVQ